MLKKYLKITVILSLVIFIFGITACIESPPSPKAVSTPIQQTTPSPASIESTPAQQTTPQPTSILTADSKPSLPIKARLTISEPPVLNKPVELTAFYSIQAPRSPDLPDTIYEIILPEQFELVSGNLKQIADLNVGQTFQQRVIVRSIKFGRNIEIFAGAYSPSHPSYFGSVSLWFLISESGAIVSNILFSSGSGGGGGNTPRPTGQPSTK